MLSRNLRVYSTQKLLLEKLRSEWLNNAKLNKQFPQKIAVQDSPQTNPDHDKSSNELSNKKRAGDNIIQLCKTASLPRLLT